jgi:hypothetical protein
MRVSQPEAPGAYRRYYADVSAGDTTAVFIYTLGGFFSARDALEAGPERLSAPRLLESSLHFARLEATSASVHGLAEVADFCRLRSPLIRWMAHWGAKS